MEVKAIWVEFAIISKFASVIKECSGRVAMQVENTSAWCSVASESALSLHFHHFISKPFLNAFITTTGSTARSVNGVIRRMGRG